MTLEELQAKVQELSTSNEALAAKNRELLTEVKTYKAKAKGVEIDPGEFEKIKTELEEARGQVETLTKKQQAELDKLTKQLQSKDGALQKYLVDGGLSEALAKAGVRPEMLDVTKAYLRGQVQLKPDGDNFAVVMGEKPLFDAVKEWAASDQGKHFVTAPANSGGGAAGGQGGGAKTVSRADFEAKSHSERAALAKDGYKVVD